MNNQVAFDSAAPPRVPSFLVLCINYDSDEETTEFLGYFQRLPIELSLSVILIDNTQREGGESPPFADSGRVSVVQPPDNLGYLGGARYGLSRYLKDRELPDWVLISNADMIIRDPDFFAHLSRLALPGVAAVAPHIRSLSSGHDQNPYMRHRPSALRMHIYKWVYRSRVLLNLTEGLAAILRKLRTHFTRAAGWVGLSGRLTHGSNPPSMTESESIYAPHGSFLILSKEYFVRGGNLDFPYFLFGEEIYIAETIRRLGLGVVHHPELEVFHHEHRSTRLFKSSKLAADVAFSAAYCADEFFPWSARR